jgi:hypothetical protein
VVLLKFDYTTIDPGYPSVPHLQGEEAQARKFLEHEKQFSFELYAIIGYFGFNLNKIEGFIDDLGTLGKIFSKSGELEQMLSTSKRFTDQLGDMLGVDFI